jgi:hypothetical protein
MTIENSGIKNPVLIDVNSGDVRPLEWKKGTTNVLEPIPVRDGVLAIADSDYFDWPVLPETPGPLIASSANGHSVKLTWEVHGGDPTSIVIERRVGDGGAWVIAPPRPIQNVISWSFSVIFSISSGFSPTTKRFSHPSAPITCSLSENVAPQPLIPASV